MTKPIFEIFCTNSQQQLISLRKRQLYTHHVPKNNFLFIGLLSPISLVVSVVVVVNMQSHVVEAYHPNICQLPASNHFGVL